MLTVSLFRGEYPKGSKWVARPENSAEKAIDCEVRTGAIRPLKLPLVIQRHIGTGLAILNQQQVIETPIPCNQEITDNQLIWVDSVRPMKYARRVDTPLVGYNLGVPRPKPNLTVTVQIGESLSDSNKLVFAYSYVNRDGSEGELGGFVETRAAHIDSTWIITVPAIEENDLTGYDKEDMKRRLYVNRGAGMHFLKEIVGPNMGRVTYQETATTGELKIVRDSDALPPEQASHVLLMPGNFLAACTPDGVYFSEPSMHHIWPKNYKLTFGRKVLGIANNVNSLYVMLEGASPAIVIILSPDAPQVYYSEIPWACVSGQSVVNTGYGVFYVSTAGIVALQDSGGSLLTVNHFDETSFSEFNPARIRAYALNGTYTAYANGQDKSFQIDMHSLSQSPEITRTRAQPTDAKVVNNTVYGVRDKILRAYGVKTLPRNAIYRTNLLRLPKPIDLRAIQVRADFKAQNTLFSIGGISEDQVTDIALGDADVYPYEQTSDPSVTIKFYDSKDRLLDHLEIQDDGNDTPIELQRVDAFYMIIYTQSEVHQISLATIQGELDLQVS